jgi:ATP-binding cassette subfamily B protein
MKLTEFFLPILKPYKWHYLMMFQIPLISVAFYIFNSFALKLVVDGSNDNLMLPIAILVGIAILQEIICRGGQFAFNKSQPFIRGEIVSRAYDYVQSHSYQFFQNNQTGSLVSKIKGIVAGYDDLFEYIWYRVTNPLFMVVFGIVSLFFINYYLAFLVFFWSLIFLVIMIKMAFNLAKLSKNQMM